MSRSLNVRRITAAVVLVLSLTGESGPGAWAGSVPVKPSTSASSSVVQCLVDAYHRLLGRTAPVPAPAQRPSLTAEARPAPALARKKAPGAPGGDLLPDPAPVRPLEAHVLAESRFLLEGEVALRDARLREAAGGADADPFMRVEGVPGARLGITPQELDQAVGVRVAASERIGAAARRAPSGLSGAGLEASAGEIRFDGVLRRLPGDQAQALRVALEAIRGPSPDLGAYLKEVWDEAFVRAIRSGDAQARSEALAGRIPERFFEEALRFRIEGQGFPPVIRIEDPLSPEDFAQLQWAGAAFIDDVDAGIVKARAAGRTIRDLPAHGRLTHLVHLDFAATVLRKKGIPPQKLRAAIQNAATNPRTGEVDVLGARSVWGYLFDQSSGSGAGLSAPDGVQGVLGESWGITR